MTELYDTIGRGYSDLRRPDPRIRNAINRALGAADTVVNVGAGAGSYEPRERTVVAIEPSMTMIRQRPAAGPAAVRAVADALPFADDAFEAALAMLTIHHWPNRIRGLSELRRVARSRVVILTWDPAAPGFWMADYFPDMLDIDSRIFPTMEELGKQLGTIDVSVVMIPHNCSDGFMGAYWRRPEAYLDARVRSAISTFAKLDRVDEGLQRLRSDLDSGAWERKHGRVLDTTDLDLGYRLVVAG